ncbi:MAG: rane-bound serine protease [Deltaproteobacteria bacterium]|nr:rane-bound serine protease [Deltaproteobacteria bacterium]
MKKLCVAFSLIIFVLLAPALHAKDIYTVRINGAINPPVAGFLENSIKKANKDNAEALVILLDTPGGLDSSMRDIVKEIMDSPVPVIVYVAPSGARAASAGAIILLASHVAAMAPGTNTGAAHPVSIGKEKTDEVMTKKVVSDAEAYSKSIAAQRGRDIDFAAKAVTESISITAKDALAKKVIDVMADSVDDLLNQIDGKAVTTKKGTVVLHTKDAKKTELPMPFKFRFLAYVSDPNVAYILMMLGIYGIIFEFYSPGAIFPGVIGGICLILALYAFQAIPISFAGLALILLGIVFFILEVKIVSHGILGIAGIISVVIGSLMLVDLPGSVFSISLSTIILVAVISALFVFGILSFAAKAQFMKVKTGREGLIGETGFARSAFTAGGKGKVNVHGEIWSAVSEDELNEGDEIVVAAVDNLIVKVRKKGG